MLIQFRFTNPTNPEDENPISATSVVLEDSTNTYGVKDNLDDDVIVDPGTEMVETSTGFYEYNYQEETLNTQYSYVVKVVYNSITYFYVFDRLCGDFTYHSNDLYATVAEYIAFATTPTDEDEVKALLEIASRLIDGYCNQNFYDNGHYPLTPAIIKRVCLIIAKRFSTNSTATSLNLSSESIGDYSYSLDVNSGSAYVKGLTSNEYNMLIPYKILPRI